MKRKSLDVQKQILEVIRRHSGITMTELERKIGTNPASLREHCEQLQFLGLVRIEKGKGTTKVIVK